MAPKNSHECIQTEKITRIERDLINMEKIQTILLKTTITIVTGITVEGVSIFFMYMLRK